MPPGNPCSITAHTLPLPTMTISRCRVRCAYLMWGGVVEPCPRLVDQLLLGDLLPIALALFQSHQGTTLICSSYLLHRHECIFVRCPATELSQFAQRKRTGPSVYALVITCPFITS